MGGMNSRTRKKLYPILVARDGEYCNECGIPGSFKSLVIDHIDNNPRNNALPNLQLLCRRHNTKKNPRGKAKHKPNLQELLPIHSSRELIKNERCEPLFREWLIGQVKTFGKIELWEALNAGAEVAGVSPATTQRYLDKLISSAGVMRQKKEDEIVYVMFKEYWDE